MKTTLLAMIFFLLASLSVQGAGIREEALRADSVCRCPPQSGQVPPRVDWLARNAVFEVVIEKFAEDPNIIYEKELDWSRVPYIIRSDGFHSVGTAFAISPTEAITNFHVINLGFEHMVNVRFFIRHDRDSEAHEVDMITGGSNEKDFLIFTVRDKTFDVYFQLERHFNIGDPVFSIGNALGEGIVIRDGLILSMVPEADSGRWEWLRHSATTTPGNSGGPIVTPDGRAVAVHFSSVGNVHQAVPSELILDSDRSVLHYRLSTERGSMRRVSYTHFLLPNRWLGDVFETRVSLPSSYAEVRQAIAQDFRPFFDSVMTALFANAPEYLTVTGGSNSYLLNDTPDLRTFPRLARLTAADNNWRFFNFSTQRFSMEDDGALLFASPQNSHIQFYKFRKPRSVSARKANTDPRFIMDTILAFTVHERHLHHDRYRITSLGEPTGTDFYLDALGRTWLTAYWSITHSTHRTGAVRLMYILPLPDGPVVLTTYQWDHSFHIWEWNLQKIADHLFVAYSASFEEWKDFLSLEEFIPDFLKDMVFEWDSEEQHFSFNSGHFAIRAGPEVFAWNNLSELSLEPFVYRSNDGQALEYGIRRIRLTQSPLNREIVTFFRDVRPDTRLGTVAIMNWDDRRSGNRFPFNGIPSINAGNDTGQMGIILENKPDSLTFFTVHLFMHNPQSTENVSRRFNAMKEGIVIGNSMQYH